MSIKYLLTLTVSASAVGGYSLRMDIEAVRSLAIPLLKFSSRLIFYEVVQQQSTPTESYFKSDFYHGSEGVARS